MKNINKIVFVAACLANIFLWMGCSDEFLQEKTDYSKLTPEIYNDYTGAKMRVEDIYMRLLPNANDGLNYRSPSGGKADIQSQSTEEFAGLSDFVNPDVVVTTTNKLTDWFHVSKATSNGPWGEIRNCNDVIEGVSGSTLSEAQKNELLGQVYFFRAWQYYLLVKTYGGVPIIDRVQAADVSEAVNLSVPRSSTKECIEFICSDLDRAAGVLPNSWGSADFGRITRGAALALKGRVRLLYASPLFNRSDDMSRWQLAYDANKKAIEALTAGGFGLAYLGSEGVNAAGWSKMFSDFNSPEAVFATLYNMVHDDDAAHEIYRNNRREQGLRPSNAAGATTNTGMSANALMVDLFPMADGKKPTEVGVYNYSTLKFFENRDPRFYRTFAFPGVTWRFEGNPLSWSGTVPSNAFQGDGKNYALWNYAWYADAAKQTNEDLPGFGADMLGQNYRGVYVRKRSNDFDMNTPVPTCLYRWPSSASENRQGAFGEGAMPHIEIRYAEVLLNFAEAACAIGNTTEAIQVLKDIRARAGYNVAIAGADYGLNVAALADRGKLFGAILYERQVEFAYEGKRFDDMRRWLLWDGGVNFSQMDGAPSSWTLSGFGGNTCTYLGVEPLNGKRRDNIELRAVATASETSGSDPIAANRPAALDLKNDLSNQFKDLATFYDSYLVRKIRVGDEVGKVITFQPNYYFIGLTSGAQTNNITLLQTIGWSDVTHGNVNGTFDPLAE